MDLGYLLIEWFVVNALWKGGPRRRSETSSPEPLYPEAERLRTLRSALQSGADVRIVYVAAGSGEMTVRVVSPENLWPARAGHWLLTAHDHLRGARRTFRVDRIEEIRTVTPPPYSPDEP